VTLRIGCVVEGHGDVRAVPILVRRIAAALAPEIPVEVIRPVRTPRYKLVKAGELERAVALASANAGAEGVVLVLVDAEDDCPATLAPELLSRAQRRLGAVPVGVVLAKVEFESWFLAAAESLSAKRNLNPELVAPANPEEIRDAKGWLSKRMRRGYRETLDQPALAAVMDLAAARRAPSFTKLWRVLQRVLCTAES